MTKFTKLNLIKDGKYLYFCPNGLRTTYADRKFVTRFRTSGVGTFATHLRKHWTVEAYFAELDAGVAPLTIVKTTGYILPHVKKWMRDAGFATTPAGYKAFMAHQNKLADERMARTFASPEYKAREARREKEMAGWVKK